ncbi:MAG: MarR family transcriptional regulator [Spirochaetales bacterium]|nr:MarR family transcriptional regulator [Spirochaetales bacterium]
MVTRLEAKILAQTGLTLNHACAVFTLASGKNTAGGLAQELRVSGPSLSRLLRPLLDRGLVEVSDSQESGADGRFKLLGLTAAGWLVYQSLRQHEGEWFPLKVLPQPAKQADRC